MMTIIFHYTDKSYRVLKPQRLLSRAAIQDLCDDFQAARFEIR
jgi:hypothetical protein